MDANKENGYIKGMLRPLQNGGAMWIGKRNKTSY